MPGKYVNCPASERPTRVTDGTKAMPRTIFATLATGFTALSLAEPAWAGPLVLDEYVDVAKCVQKSGQLCPPVVYRQAYIDTPSVKVEFTASGNHCSDIIAHIIVDGQEWGSNIVAPAKATAAMRSRWVPVSTTSVCRARASPAAATPESSRPGAASCTSRRSVTHTGGMAPSRHQPEPTDPHQQKDPR
jgi:hypothetical protein